MRFASFLSELTSNQNYFIIHTYTGDIVGKSIVREDPVGQLSHILGKIPEVTNSRLPPFL